MDDQQRAKELQIATLAESSRCLGVAQAKSDNDASEYWFNKEREAIAALRAAPEGFVMVPVEPTARPLEEWHDDTTNGGGDSVWFTWDAERGEWLGEPAWIGRPNDSDWPGYHTHWLPHPAFPAMLAARPQGVKDGN